MKTILAYGDSLTWGMNARTMARHAHDDLWPTVLERQLGGGARVINAGLNGRSTMFDDHGTPADRNGARVLPTILATFEPLDLVIFMLGANDLKTFTGNSAVAAAQGIKRLVEISRSFPYIGGHTPKILVVSPPLILRHEPSAEQPLLSPRVHESDRLADAYSRVAAATGAEFFDAASVASAEGGGDGVHLDAANTRAIGEALAPIVAGILSLKEAKAA